MDNNTSGFNKTECSSSQGFGRADAEYYFNIIVFKVENTIFRVPRNGFDVPGTIFETIFSLPVTGDDIQGSSDSNPVVLPVSEEYFRGFLRAMYAINGHQMTETDWLGALDLSTMWMFNQIRRRAARALDDWIKQRNAKEAVLLAKKYRIANWLTDAYARILEQQTLTATGLSASPFSLDWETIARILSAREAVRVKNIFSGLCGPNCTTTRQYSLTTADLEIVIEDEFKGETARIKDEHHP